MNNSCILVIDVNRHLSGEYGYYVVDLISCVAIASCFGIFPMLIENLQYF